MNNPKAMRQRNSGSSSRGGPAPIRQQRSRKGKSPLPLIAGLSAAWMFVCVISSGVSFYIGSEDIIGTVNAAQLPVLSSSRSNPLQVLEIYMDNYVSRDYGKAEEMLSVSASNQFSGWGGFAVRADQLQEGRGQMSGYQIYDFQQSSAQTATASVRYEWSQWAHTCQFVSLSPTAENGEWEISGLGEQMSIDESSKCEEEQ